jgi:hypothetical protein
LVISSAKKLPGAATQYGAGLVVCAFKKPLVIAKVPSARNSFVFILFVLIFSTYSGFEFPFILIN